MLNKYLAVIVIGITSTPLLQAQVDTFTLSSGAVSGGNVTLALSVNSPPGNEPAAVQWTLTYPDSSVASATAVAGASLTSAAKSLSCAVSDGSYTCVVSGSNTSIIGNGVVASITFTMTDAASSTPITLAVAGADPSGGALNVNATGGTISGGGSISGGGGSGSSGGSGTTGSGSTTGGGGGSTTGGGSGSTTGGGGGSTAGGGSSTTAGGGSTTGGGSGSTTGGSGSTTGGGSGGGSGSTTGGSGSTTGGGGSTSGGGTTGGGSSGTGTNGGGSTSGGGSTTGGGTTGGGSSGTGSNGGGTSGNGGGSGSTSGGTSVSSVSCNPTKLIGGSPTTCVVYLKEPAPWDGQVVSLFAFTTVGLMPASAPASITIPASAQSGTFVVTTSPVTSIVTVLIAAEAGAVGKYATIVLAPGGSPTSKLAATAGSSPPRLSCTPRTMTSPGTVTCELQLATPSNEARDVALSSSHPSLHVPDVVTVRAHQSSLSFQAVVDETAPSGTLSIEASAGDLSAADLTSEERITVIAQTERAQVAPPRKTADSATGALEIRSVGNAASGSAESVCVPGSLASIQGTELARGEGFDPLGRSLALAGTTVAVNGKYVPLVYASASKVVFICPAGTAGPVSVSLETGDRRTANVSLASRDSAPGIFTVDGSGQGQAAATIFNGLRLAMVRNYRYSSEPAQPGDTMSIAVTGVSSAADAGRLWVVIGDVRVPVNAVHAATGQTGVQGIAVTIPSSAPTGDAVPIAVEELLPDGTVASSQKATIAIESIRR